MRPTLAVMIAVAALGASPAAAQNADQATNNAVAAPAPADTNVAVVENTTTVATQETVAVPAPEATAADNAATQPAANGNKRLPWGLLGLLGLIGLFGRRRSA
jgi:hypothetical protein